MSNPLSNPLSNPMQNSQYPGNNFQQSNPLINNPNFQQSNPNYPPNYPPNYSQPIPNYNQPNPNYPPNYNQPNPNYPPNYNQPNPNYPPNYNQPNPNYPPNYNDQQQPNLPPNLNSDVVNPRINDPELYHAMKRVVEIQKGKKLYDAMPDTNIGKEQKEIEEELQKKEEEERKKKEEEDNLLSQQVPQQPQAIQKAFKNLFNKDMIRNNSIRRSLLTITVILISVYSLMWEYLCLFENVCFGEEQDLEKWISHCICPLLFLLIIFVTLLYFFSDYIYKSGIKLTNIFIALLSIACVVIGIIGLIILARKGTKSKDDCHGLNEVWYLLTDYERDFYSSNDDLSDLDKCDKLWDKYKLKMSLTNIILIVAGGIGILLVIYSFCFYWMLTDTAFDWRPPMRSHLHDDRAKRIIDIYFKNNEEFRRLYEAEHKKEIDEQLKMYQQNMGMIDNNNNQGGNDNEGFELPTVSKKKNQADENTSLKNDVDNNNIINNQENNNNDNNNIINNQENNNNDNNNLINNQENNNNNNNDNNNISNQENNENNKKKRTIPKRHVKSNDDQQQ